jgi:hypothetical protein
VMLPPPPNAKSWLPSQHGSSASSWSVSWALQGVRVDGQLGARVVAIVFAGENVALCCARDLCLCWIVM